MRLSRIEARRVFTRYGWRPINSTEYATVAGKCVITLQGECYTVQMCESASGYGLKIYAKVTDRRCNERYHLSADVRKLRLEEMKQELKLKLITKL